MPDSFEKIMQQQTLMASLLDASGEIARVVFSMFVHVADVQQNITPQEVRRFQASLDETAWITSDDLRRGLSQLKDKYSSFWANYEDGALAVDTASIAESLERVGVLLGADRNKLLRRELNSFVERLDRGPYRAKLVQSDKRARSQARKELLAILVPENEPPAATDNKDGDGANDGMTAVAAPATSVWHAAPLSPGNAETWTSGKTKVRCVSVVLETHDTKTYSFLADPQTLFVYKPGQFVSIEVPVGGTVLRRCYTISSSPSRPYSLSITVKRVPNGQLSNWLFENVAEGFECTINSPAGDFTCLNHPAEKLLFLAAGSGITPCMSMLRWLADTSSNADIVFINNARTPDDMIFYHEMLYLSARLGNRMRLAIVPAAVPSGTPWHGLVGRLDEKLLRILAPDFAEREAFVCGPHGYMDAAKSLLMSMGYPSHRYHQESFGAARPATAAAAQPAPVAPLPAAAAAAVKTARGTAGTWRVTTPAAAKPAPVSSLALAPSLQGMASTGASIAPFPQAGPSSHGTPSAPNPVPAVQKTAPATLPSATQRSGPAQPSGASALPIKAAKPGAATINLRGSGAGFPARPGQTILEAAEASGIELQHSCRSGICGTCKMRKISGRVTMHDQVTLTDAEIEAGYILSCVAMADGDVTLSE
jgi:ferredoxin-NADP reductase/ferredoxin